MRQQGQAKESMGRGQSGAKRLGHNLTAPVLQCVAEPQSHCFKSNLRPPMMGAASTLTKAHIFRFHATLSYGAFPVWQPPHKTAEWAQTIHPPHPDLFWPPSLASWAWSLVLWLSSHFPAQLRFRFDIGRGTVFLSLSNAAPLSITLCSPLPHMPHPSNYTRAFTHAGPSEVSSSLKLLLFQAFPQSSIQLLSPPPLRN